MTAAGCLGRSRWTDPQGLRARGQIKSRIHVLTSIPPTHHHSPRGLPHSGRAWREGRKERGAPVGRKAKGADRRPLQTGRAFQWQPGAHPANQPHRSIPPWRTAPRRPTPSQWAAATPATPLPRPHRRPQQTCRCALERERGHTTAPMLSVPIGQSTPLLTPAPHRSTHPHRPSP